MESTEVLIDCQSVWKVFGDRSREAIGAIRAADAPARLRVRDELGVDLLLARGGARPGRLADVDELGDGGTIKPLQPGPGTLVEEQLEHDRGVAFDVDRL